MMNNTQRRRKEGWNMERSRALVLCENNFINYGNSAFFPSPSRLQNDEKKRGLWMYRKTSGAEGCRPVPERPENPSSVVKPMRL